jgi:hypothetical protein
LSGKDRRNRITANSSDQVKGNVLNGFIGTICVALISLLAFTLPFPVTHYSSIELQATEERMTRLRRGINTSHWFAQVSPKQGYTKSHFDSHTTAADIPYKGDGTNIRYSVEIAPMFNSGRRRASAQYLGHVDRA